MQLFSQRDPQWAGHILGSGPGTIGSAGCLLTCDAMVNWDAFGDSHYNPAALDELIASRGDFVAGELLNDGVLAALWADRYSWRRVNGWDSAQFDAAIASPDTYVIVGLAGPGTHFVLGYGASGFIADPWTGKVGALGGYLGTGWHVTDMVFVTKHTTPPPPPPVPPAPLPPPTPVPVPHFYVEDDQDVVLLPPQPDLVTAKAGADKLAAANPGRKYVVEDDTEAEVYTAFLTPQPVPPVPVPTPAPVPGPGPAPSPPPETVSWLRAFIIWLRKLLGI